MTKLVIGGGKPLSGRVKISGAKNAVLPLIAASMLAKGESKLNNAPQLDDVNHLLELLASLGVQFQQLGDQIIMKADSLQNFEAPYDFVSKMRASFLIMGPLLARHGRAKVAFPGGCKIGTRPIDLHLKGFSLMGAEIRRESGFVEAIVRGRLQGTKIYLDYPSVGATENLMMAATLAEGVTCIENAAEEPEIVDLANYLNAMGANVMGAGTKYIVIEGVQALSGAAHTVIPDRIEAGTFMVAAAVTGGNIILENIVLDHLQPVMAKLEEARTRFVVSENNINVIGPTTLLPVNIQTMPYPGFPTDMQAQMVSMLAKAQGTSIITETVFENRYMYVEELNRMGADIRVEGRLAIVQGVPTLTGSHVRATDLRGGAALVLAGLAANGETVIDEVYHIDRGYEKLEEKLVSLGANIKKL